MHVNLESKDRFSIEAYTNQDVTIDAIHYSESCIISASGIDSNWPIRSIDELIDSKLLPLLIEHPKVILIGHTKTNSTVPMMTIQSLAKQQIGIEIMSIGAACRTFNVLLNEKRAVVLGLIF